MKNYECETPGCPTCAENTAATELRGERFRTREWEERASNWQQRATAAEAEAKRIGEMNVTLLANRDEVCRYSRGRDEEIAAQRAEIERLRALLTEAHGILVGDLYTELPARIDAALKERPCCEYAAFPWNVGKVHLLHTPTEGQDLTRSIFPLALEKP